ncbi:hypothetical protein D3C80_1851500 [compost metagenome]
MLCAFMPFPRARISLCLAIGPRAKSGLGLRPTLVIKTEQPLRPGEDKRKGHGRPHTKQQTSSHVTGVMGADDDARNADSKCQQKQKRPQTGR